MLAVEAGADAVGFLVGIRHLTEDSLAPTMAVWSKNSSSLSISEKLKYFNADELIEGTARFRMR
jgi:hypothetical protein